MNILNNTIQDFNKIYPYNTEKNKNKVEILKKKFKSQFIEEPKFYTITNITNIMEQNYIDCNFYSIFFNSEESIITGYCESDLINNQIIIDNTSIKYEKIIFNFSKMEKNLKLEDESNYNNTIKYSLKYLLKLNINLDKSIKIMIDSNDLDFLDFNNCFNLFNNIIVLFLRVYKIKINFEDIVKLNENYANIFFPKITGKLLLSYINTLYKLNNNECIIYDRWRQEINIEKINDKLGYIKLDLSRKNSVFQNNNYLNKLYYELKVAFKLLDIEEVEHFDFNKLIILEEKDFKDILNKKEIDELINIDSFYLINKLEYSNEFFKFNFLFNIKNTAQYFYNMYKDFIGKGNYKMEEIFDFTLNLTKTELEENILKIDELDYINNILLKFDSLIKSYSFLGKELYETMIIVCNWENVKTLKVNILKHYLKYQDSLMILKPLEEISSINTFNTGISIFDPVNSFWL